MTTWEKNSFVYYVYCSERIRLVMESAVNQPVTLSLVAADWPDRCEVIKGAETHGAPQLQACSRLSCSAEQGEQMTPPGYSYSPRSSDRFWWSESAATTTQTLDERHVRLITSSNISCKTTDAVLQQHAFI